MKRILSIDGGGIRGIVPAFFLAALEEGIQQATGNKNARIADYFDLIAGTSTGGIMTCSLLAPGEADPARPRFTAREILELYATHGKDVFRADLLKQAKAAKGLPAEKYDAEGLEKMLQLFFGNLRLSQLLKPCLITAYDINRRKAHFFRQHRAKEQFGDDFLVKDVARATSAAPTYFDFALIDSLAGEQYPLIDGAVFANNPAQCALTEVLQQDASLQPRDVFILSIGTGSANEPYKYKNAKHWGLIKWVGPLMDIMMSGSVNPVDYQLRTLYKAMGATQQYVRLQPAIPERIFMDQADDQSLGRLHEAAQSLLKKEQKTLETLIGYLTG